MTRYDPQSAAWENRQARLRPVGMRQGEIALILDIHTSLPRKAVELYRNGNGGCTFSLMQISCTGTRQTTSSAECEMTQPVLRNRPVETIRKGGRGGGGGTKASLHIYISLPRESVALADVGSVPDQIRMRACSLADKCVMRITRGCLAMHLGTEIRQWTCSSLDRRA